MINAFLEERSDTPYSVDTSHATPADTVPFLRFGVQGGNVTLYCPYTYTGDPPENISWSFKGMYTLIEFINHVRTSDTTEAF